MRVFINDFHFLNRMKPINPLPDNKNKIAFNIIEEVVNNHEFLEPFFIGITGAGGAGKTTFGNNITEYFGKENCLSIDLDDYLISRDERRERDLTGYNPLANNLSLARKQLIDLSKGRTVMKPRYNHSNGKILSSEEIKPLPLIIVEGVTTLYDELRGIYSVAIFMDASEETQIQSRIERDVKKRGYSFEEAMLLYEKVKPDYKKFIEPTKEFADIEFIVNKEYVMRPVKYKNRLESLNK